MARRAALVIGVSKTGDLPVLNAPARSASDVGSWLRTEGYDVVLLTDEAGPINALLPDRQFGDVGGAGDVDALLSQPHHGIGD